LEYRNILVSGLEETCWLPKRIGRSRVRKIQIVVASSSSLYEIKFLKFVIVEENTTKLPTRRKQ
jgi:hypothetical protein